MSSRELKTIIMIKAMHDHSVAPLSPNINMGTLHDQHAGVLGFCLLQPVATRSLSSLTVQDDNSLDSRDPEKAP